MNARRHLRALRKAVYRDDETDLQFLLSTQFFGSPRQLRMEISEVKKISSSKFPTLYPVTLEALCGRF